MPPCQHFLRSFFSLLSCLRNERDHITLLSLVMKIIIPENSPLKSYAEFVTPYAFKHIEQQSSVKYNPDSFYYLLLLGSGAVQKDMRKQQ